MGTDRPDQTTTAEGGPPGRPAGRAGLVTGAASGRDCFIPQQCGAVTGGTSLCTGLFKKRNPPNKRLETLEGVIPQSLGTHMGFFYNKFFISICDVAKLAIIHKKMQSNLAIEQVSG